MDGEIYIRIQETDVLVKNHKIAYSDKKSGISIDILNVKILENISPKRINLVFENTIIRQYRKVIRTQTKMPFTMVFMAKTGFCLAKGIKSSKYHIKCENPRQGRCRGFVCTYVDNFCQEELSFIRLITFSLVNSSRSFSSRAFVIV